MPKPVIKIVPVRGEDSYVWSFSAEAPRFSYGNNGHFSTPIDPTPGHAHDPKEVQRTVRTLKRVLPPKANLTYYLLDREETARTNGSATQEFRTYDSEKQEYDPIPPFPDGYVVLSGKRIPPHPAMTRYLTAHEYGHHVQDWVEGTRELKPNGLFDEYAKIRDLPSPKAYGPRGWPTSTGEVFACDFRVLVAQVELEFWPHPGVPRPDAKTKVAKDIQAYWADIVKELT